MKRFLVFVTCFLACLPLAWATFAADYRLGSGDRLNIRAVIWNEETRTFDPWSVISGEYTVQPDGALSIPIAGSVSAAGLTLSELSRAIGAGLQAEGGIVDVPTIAAEILTFRPFYILGDVARPGEYPAAPGLTAMRALAVAGGGSGHDAEISDPAVELRDAGTLRELRSRLSRARARETRLEAEIAGAEEVSFSKSILHPDGEEALAAIQGAEIAIFDARQAAMNRELAALNELDDLLSNEAEALDSKLNGQQEQIRLALDTVEKVTSMVDRGIAPATRLTDAQRRLIDLESKETDLQSELYRARQRISENQRDIVALQANRAIEATIELQKVQAELEELMTRYKVQERLIAARGTAMDLTDLTETVTTFSVLRVDGEGQSIAMEVSPTEAIEPGDVLTVRTTLSEPALVSQ